jgi:hypothetical protein
MPTFALGDTIPTGSWDIYYHNPLDTRWSIESYEKLATVKTWGDFFSIIKEFEDITISHGMIFCMREGITPLYENHANIKGGCYSIRVSRQKATRYFMLYALACMLGKVVEDPVNIIQGFSISPKRIVDKNQNFNVIKIWNKDCTKFNKSEELCHLDNVQQSSEIIYTPHIQKKL